MDKSIDPRAPKMAQMYRSGKVLAEIGRAYGLTRERVRQLLKAYGLSREDGGETVKAAQRAQTNIEKRLKKLAQTDAKYQRFYGCSKAQVDALGPASKRSSPAGRYAQQRWHAKRRSVAWEISLPEWWSVWSESGKWSERGQGKFCMIRPGDVGPYKIGNVLIATAEENGKDYQSQERAKRYRFKRKAQA